MSPRLQVRARGCTLTEVMVAMVLGLLVCLSVMACFMWSGRHSLLCSRIAWSQAEAMRTSDKIELLVRNAAAISAIDQTNGNWVEFSFADGSTRRLAYTNQTLAPRSGLISLQAADEEERILVRGVTKLMTPTGYSVRMFDQINDRAVRIAYRVTDPGLRPDRAADDSLYASCVQFAVCLRNTPD